jgi:hypothetical protein
MAERPTFCMLLCFLIAICSIFKLDEFGLTLSQISDVNLKDFISFRRL